MDRNLFRVSRLLRQFRCHKYSYETKLNQVKHSYENDVFQKSSISTSVTRLEKLKVLYDGQCPICVTEINLMKALDRNNKTVKFIDITVGEYKPEEHSGISYQQAMGKMHVISSDGQISDSMVAMKKMYSAVGLDWLSKLLSLPGIKQASDRFYIWFAINRYWLTGRNREDCESGRCKIPEKK